MYLVNLNFLLVLYNLHGHKGTPSVELVMCEALISLTLSILRLFSAEHELCDLIKNQFPCVQ